ncbi:unnamed protein product, partial [Ascophyllum nodosum]
RVERRGLVGVGHRLYVSTSRPWAWRAGDLWDRFSSTIVPVGYKISGTCLCRKHSGHMSYFAHDEIYDKNVAMAYPTLKLSLQKMNPCCQRHKPSNDQTGSAHTCQ